MTQAVNDYQKGYIRKLRLVSLFVIHSTLFISPLFAQSPYELKTGREIGLLGLGVTTVALGEVMNTGVKLHDPATYQALNRQSVNAFDRGATYQYSHTADQLSDGTLAANLGGIAVLTLGAKPMRSDVKTIGVMYLETILIINGIKQDIKVLTGRFRPYVYNPDVPLAEKTTEDGIRSFFSGHAANAFGAAVFTGEVFRHYFPNSRLKPVIWIGSMGLATATAVLRYEAGKHYPSDLLVGAAFGSLVGWGIPKLHEVRSRAGIGRRLDVQPWSTGSANGIYVRLLVFSR